MDVRLVEMARAHDGLVSWSGLRKAGMTSEEIRGELGALRRLHDGVYLTGHGRLTDHQRWLAATLSAPQTVLSHASAGALHGFRPRSVSAFEVVTRPGSGGPRRIGNLLVCRSRTLSGEVVTRDGISVTSPTRTLIDLCAQLARRQRGKAIREGIRLGAFTALEVRLAAARYRGRRGIAGLADHAGALERLPIARTRSDAEARALEVLDAARIPAPLVNVTHAGEEADLSWPQHRLVIEIDGPQYHQDASEDARKEERWRSKGWTVQRISSNAVFGNPEALVALIASRRGGAVRPRRGASGPPPATAASSATGSRSGGSARA
jgi:hypothetical protein